MRKKANMQLCLVTGLISVLCASLLYVSAVNSNADIKQNIRRFKNQYKSEAAIDLAVGLFANSVDKKEFALAYEKTDTGFRIIPQLSPYLFELDDELYFPLAAEEAIAYLASAGYPDIKVSGVSVKVDGESCESFRIGNIMTDYAFNTSPDAVVAILPDITVEALSGYGYGSVRETAVISGIKIKREAFDESLEENLTDSVHAVCDCSDVSITVKDYQSYGGVNDA